MEFRRKKSEQNTKIEQMVSAGEQNEDLQHTHTTKKKKKKKHKGERQNRGLRTHTFLKTFIRTNVVFSLEDGNRREFF